MQLTSHGGNAAQGDIQSKRNEKLGLFKLMAILVRLIQMAVGDYVKSDFCLPQFYNDNVLL
jgi:hypothetical protein